MRVRTSTGAARRARTRVTAPPPRVWKGPSICARRQAGFLIVDFTRTTGIISDWSPYDFALVVMGAPESRPMRVGKKILRLAGGTAGENGTSGRFQPILRHAVPSSGPVPRRPRLRHVARWLRGPSWDGFERRSRWRRSRDRHPRRGGARPGRRASRGDAQVRRHRAREERRRGPQFQLLRHGGARGFAREPREGGRHAHRCRRRRERRRGLRQDGCFRRGGFRGGVGSRPRGGSLGQGQEPDGRVPGGVPGARHARADQGQVQGGGDRQGEGGGSPPPSSFPSWRASSPNPKR